MLFSNTEVAKYINESFEPTWKSLRPVPKVSIDFGNGKVLDRTLNGNIATFVCTADGAVVDIIAGLHDAEDYVRRLRDAEQVAASLPAEPIARADALRGYHLQQAQRDDVSGAGLPDDVTPNGPRHKQIHEKLAQLPAAKPERLTKWLYREVLHVDLDDPYLGLKPVLFASYPFADDNKN